MTVLCTPSSYVSRLFPVASVRTHSKYCLLPPETGTTSTSGKSYECSAFKYSVTAGTNDVRVLEERQSVMHVLGMSHLNKWTIANQKQIRKKRNVGTLGLKQKSATVERGLKSYENKAKDTTEAN